MIRPVIRWASFDDIPTLLALEARALPSELRSNAGGLSSAITSDCVAIATADEEGRGPAIGMGIARQRGAVWLLAIVAVDPDHRRRGLGKRIVQGLLRQAPAGCPTACAVAVSEAGARLLVSAGFTGDGAAFTLQLQKAA